MDIAKGIKKLCDNNSVLFYVTNLHGEILFLNNFGKKIFKVTEDNIEAGININSFYLHPEDREELIRNLESEQLSDNSEIRLQGRDGEIFTGYEHAIVSSDETEGNLVLSLIHDISEFVTFSLNISKLNLELADTNRKLQEAYHIMVQHDKMAAIGELAAGVAHEINNPLAYIKSNTRSLYRYLDTITGFLREKSEQFKSDEIDNVDFVLSDMTDIIKENEKGLDRIAVITKSLKRFSRMGDEMVQDNFDLNQAITDTLNIAKSQYKYIADIKLFLDELPLIRCNGDSIIQVILNLIVNAVNAVESLGSKENGEIIIKTSVCGNNVKFSVKDSGPGVDPSVKNKIFDPFFTTKEIGKGTGLGLSLCYDIIVRKHNGNIWFENNRNDGAQFNFTIPIVIE